MLEEKEQESIAVVQFEAEEFKQSDYGHVLKPNQVALFCDGRLMEEPTWWLADMAASSRRSRPNTWLAAGNALKNWYEYCAAAKFDWRQATRDDAVNYRDAYLSAISPKTGEPYSPNTVLQRLIYICDFYEWLGHSVSDYSHHEKKRSIDSNALAHLRFGSRTVKRNNILPRGRRSKNSIRPLSTSEIGALRRALGSDPTVPDASDIRPSRDVVFFDLAVSTGARLQELHDLKTHQFLGLTPDPALPYGFSSIEVIGKGGKKRTIRVINSIVTEVQNYIAGEREDAIRTGKMTGPKDQKYLWVQGKNSAFPGRRIGYRRLQQIVEEGCVRAGLVTTTEKVDPETRVSKIVKVAKHCVHDLRHTYACLTYMIESNGGNSEPWKLIQAQLGHRLLTTTIDTYLEYVVLFVDFRDASRMAKLLSGQI